MKSLIIGLAVLATVSSVSASEFLNTDNPNYDKYRSWLNISKKRVSSLLEVGECASMCALPSWDFKGECPVWVDVCNYEDAE